MASVGTVTGIHEPRENAATASHARAAAMTAANTPVIHACGAMNPARATSTATPTVSIIACDRGIGAMVRLRQQAVDHVGVDFGPGNISLGEGRGEDIAQALRGGADDHDAIAERGGIDLRLHALDDLLLRAKQRVERKRCERRMS